MANISGSENSASGGSQSPVNGSVTGGDGIIRIDPADIDAAASGRETPSVGTRPGYGPNGRKLNRDGTERKAKGSGGNATRTTAPVTPLSVDAATFALVGMHALLSATLKIPELSLDPKEATQMALALQNLQRFYNIQVTEKALAWSNLCMTLATIYGTRGAAYAARMKMEGRNPRQDNVIRPQQFRPAVVTPQAPASPGLTPDGDPTQPMPLNGGTSAKTAGDAAFAATPPEFM